jgi:hypothetical protein
MRSLPLEDLPRWEGTHRHGRRDHTHERHGAELGHRVYMRMVRVLRRLVGRHWSEALAGLDEAVHGWHLDAELVRDRREWLLRRLFDRRPWGGVRARDGDLTVDALTGRLTFAPYRHKRRAPEAYTAAELRPQPELFRN